MSTPVYHYNSRLAKFILPNGYLAITFGRHIFVKGSDLPVRYMRHEEWHVRQWEREGTFKFAIKYVYYWMRYGYNKNPYEVEAREHEN